MQANELFDRPNTILLDGGMGTMLQAAGLKLGARPEELNITDPALIESIHARYAAAGSRIINANTFGASAHKLAGSEYTLEEIIAAGIANCKRACAPYGALAALDVGPLGELLEPNGTLAFEDAVAEYGRIVRAGVVAGADLVFLETFTDLYELKAALLAVKENSSLPVLASMSFEAGGRTFTGCTVESFAATARGLGADAVGINCSLGPKEIFPMAKRLTEALPGSFPVFVKPNAGLPRADGSGYDITPQLYAMQMKPYRELGLFAAGGCCGTTPEFIQLLNGVFADCRPGRPDHPMKSVVCSPMDCVDVDGITVVGERINPTGKKRFQQALREGDMNYVLEQAVSQTEAGAQILDVNVGAPGVDEPALMEQVVKALQSVVSLPLQLDSSHAEALERGLRVYNGKPIVNSVNGEAEKLNTILPLCKKYGAAVVGLAIDERGILPKAEDRVAIARRIRDAALAAGIPQEDIYIDCLTLTASAQQEDVLATVQALHACKEELGVRTILGVSNISFGLPCRSYLNTTFLTMAMYAGLDLAIMNPSSEEMMAAVYAYNVLTNRDKQSTKYIERYANRVPASAALVQAVQNAQTAPAAGETPEAAGPYAPLMKAVEKGLKGEAAARTRALLEEKEPLELVDEALIPALDIVGAKYEKGTLFLPQLLQAATAAQDSSTGLHNAVNEARARARAAHDAFDDANARLSAARVDKGRLEVQVDAAVNAIVHDCKVPLDRALETPELEDRGATEDAAFKLRRRIANMGTINPDAAEEYEQLKGRYDYLAAQLSDLDGARRSLAKIVRVIDARMKDDFVRTFDAVNKNFSEIFAVLFPGGSAELTLVNPDDLESTGVEVTAQPRGKRITKMMLMSGGEKSLTALALLFAVYRIRTTPFYILDEVEAALDDSNLRRLTSYLESLRDTTQLIMITHQRRTMEMADVLFGVSMQADGVTKVVSQKLDRALQYAE